MKKILFSVLCAALFQGSTVATSQQLVPPAETVQAITSAIQQGNLKTAGELYQGAQKVTSAQSATAPASPGEPTKASLFEQTLPGNLRQFGYDLFNRTASSFAPPSTMSVGPDYVIGPGDQFTLTLWGTTEGIYNLQVSKEGRVTLPKVGVISVAGIRFGELERTLKQHLTKYYSEFNLSVAMGGLKTLTIYVVGEVAKPGSYSLFSLTTVYGALFAAGGPTKQGTLRTIQVLRSGKVVKTIDLYEFLLKGDRSQDIKLQNEDTVFVPLIGPLAGIAGTVYRPAIYELIGQETLGDVIQTAGGIMPMALGGRLQLMRYEDNQRKVIMDIKIEAQQQGAPKTADAFREKVRNMDAISIRPVYDQVWETVDLIGAVEHPGSFQWRPDMKLREIIMQGQLLPKADRKRAEVVRIGKNMIERTIIPVDIAMLLAGDESQNLVLEPKDKIQIYSVEQNPVNVWETVNLAGTIRSQGNFQWKPGLTVREIITQGQLLPQSDLGRAEVIRLSKNLTDRTVIPVDLGALMAGDESKNVTLEPQDQVRVYTTFKAAEKVSVGGEVLRTGEFEITKGERLSDLLKRAGGITREGYTYGAVFKRKDVKIEEIRHIKTLMAKTQAQIARSAAAKTAAAVNPEETASAKSELAMSQGLLDSLKAIHEQADGRVVINISENIEQWAGSKNDLLLQDGDSLFIPKRPQGVLVLGEVHSPGAQIFLSDMTLKDYLDHTGGLTKNADRDEIYVMQADGYAYGADSPSVGNLDKIKLKAGDTIVVPENVDRGAGLRFAKDVLDMLFKTAIIIATVHILF